MASAISAPPITVEQYQQFRGHPSLRDELINGEIILSPQPKPLHQQVAQNIADALRMVLRGQSFTPKQNTNVRLPSAFSMPAPDVFVVSRAEWRRACRAGDYVAECPVLAVEVISPANRKKM